MTTQSGAIEVIVPAYRRPNHLERCLRALSEQILQPDRVVVVTRASDPESTAVVARHPDPQRTTIASVVVNEPGVIAAMAAGVAVSSAPLVAFTDDDARPRPDWLERIVRHFSDPTVGGVGGRDVLPAASAAPLTSHVGYFAPWGKLYGNHHIGCGSAREVHVLKGVNMAFRLDALALPRPRILRGTGAQVEFEVMMCRWATLQGWRLLYDPAVLVDHDAAPRTGPDRRQNPAPEAVSDYAYNAFTAVTALRPVVPAQLLYTLAVGARGRPGPLRAALGLIRGEDDVVARFPPAMSGYVAAARDALKRRRQADDPIMVTAHQLRDLACTLALPPTRRESGS